MSLCEGFFAFFLWRTMEQMVTESSTAFSIWLKGASKVSGFYQPVVGMVF